MKRHLIALLATALVGLASASAETATGTLALSAPTSTYNRFTVTISGALNDSDISDVSGTLDVALDSNVTTGATTAFTLNGGNLAMQDMAFSGFLWNLEATGLAGTAVTNVPPGAATATSTGGTFSGALHRLIINQGSIAGTVVGQSVTETFTSTAPLAGNGSGTGVLTVTPTSQTEFQQFFTVVMTMPVDFTQQEVVSGQTIYIRVQGTLRATGTVVAPLYDAQEIAAWTFNTGTTSAARRTASGVASGMSVSTLNFNSSFTFAGTNNVPGAPNDGIGFGGNSGDTVIFLLRASYFDDSAVPSPRPTAESYTSWGPGSTAGTGANLAANGNAPIAFTVSADAFSTILIDSLTVDFTGGGIIFQFQEAGASPGTAVMASGAQDGRFTIPLATPVAINPGQTKTFTINLNSGALSTGHNIDGIALNGVVETQTIIAWDGGGGTTDYATAANWDGDVIPGDGNTSGASIGNASDQTVIHNTATSYTSAGTGKVNSLLVGTGAGGVGSLTLSGNAGALTFGGDGYNNAAWIGSTAGTTSATGVVTVSAGKLAIGTGAGSDASINLGVSTNNTAGAKSGTLIINGGTVEVGRRILMGANHTATTGILTISSGTLDMKRTGSNGEGDLGRIRFGSGNNTVNLDGGTVIFSGFHTSGASNLRSTIYMNGTMLKANATIADLFNGTTANANLQLKTGGLVVDTNTFNVTVNDTLTQETGHTAILRKEGIGTLTITGAQTGRSGTTTVNGGTLRVSGSGSLGSGSTTASGSGSVLDLDRNDTWGNHAGSSQSLTIQQGGLVTNGTQISRGFNAVKTLALDGCELRVTGTARALADADLFKFEAYGIRDSVTVTGTSASSITNPGALANAGINIGGTIDLGGGVGASLTFDVADVTGSSATDLAVSTVLKDNYVQTIGFPRLSNGLVKTGAGTLTLSAVNRYTGVTEVNGGTLVLNQAFLADTADVYLSTGATLQLDFAGSDTINGLFIAGSPQAAGTWGRIGHPTAENTSALITGDGLLVVTTEPPAGYAGWAALFASFTDTDPAIDFENDGLASGIEWVVGGDPTLNDAATVAPTFDNISDPDDFLFTFRRRDEAAADPGTSIVVEYGSDLSGWTPAENGVDGVTIDDSTDLGGGFHQVTVAIPRTLAGGSGKLFARLQATQP